MAIDGPPEGGQPAAVGHEVENAPDGRTPGQRHAVSIRSAPAEEGGRRGAPCAVNHCYQPQSHRYPARRQEAQPPIKADGPGRMVMMMAGFVAGALLGLGIAALIAIGGSIVSRMFAGGLVGIQAYVPQYGRAAAVLLFAASASYLLALLFDFALDALFFVPLDLVGMTHAPSAPQTRNCARTFLNPWQQRRTGIYVPYLFSQN